MEGIKEFIHYFPLNNFKKVILETKEKKMS